MTPQLLYYLRRHTLRLIDFENTSCIIQDKVKTWEQRKLLDCLTQPISDGPHETPDLVDEGIPFISVDAIVDNKIDFDRKRGYITEEYDLECRKKYSPQRDDVYLVKSGSTVGKVAIVETDERFNIWSPLAAMRANKEVLLPKYLYYYLQLDDIQDEVSAKSKGGTQPNLSMRILEKFIVRLPDVEEQKKISDSLSDIDNLITLHQRKCDDTKKLKKFMLQKMFPKNGEKNPEIRFAGFTDDWEQRKLGDVFKEYSEKKHEELPPLTIIQGGGTILREESDRALQYDKNSLSGYKMVKKNDFIVHLRSFEGGLEKANSDGIISPAYHTFHGDNTDSRFYYPFFRSRRFIDVLLKPHVYGIRDGKSIDIEGMKTIMIPVPSYEEQKKIGEYIETLDNLITLHQRKCDELKEVKKYMLQNMFPGK